MLGELGVAEAAVSSGEARGRSVAENLDRLIAWTRVAIRPEELYARVQEQVLDRPRAGIDPMPGAARLLRDLRLAGIQSALVTSSYRAMVDAVLPSLTEAAFEVILAGDEVRHPKPDPEPYRTAAARLGVPPGRCVVVEDSSTGVRSGLAAGCVVVAVAPARETSGVHLGRHVRAHRRPARPLGRPQFTGWPAGRRLQRACVSEKHCSPRTPASSCTWTAKARRRPMTVRCSHGSSFASRVPSARSRRAASRWPTWPPPPCQLPAPGSSSWSGRAHHRPGQVRPEDRSRSSRALPPTPPRPISCPTMRRSRRPRWALPSTSRATSSAG